MKYLSIIMRFVLSLTRPAPSRDWHIILTVVGLLGATMVGVALYFYIGLETGALITPVAPREGPPPSLSREALSRVLKVYEQRAVNYDAGNIPTPKTGSVK